MANWQDELGRLIDQRFEQMVEMRRRIHRHPEVSGQEFETSLLLYQELGNRGFQVRLGPEGRGVIADLDPPENGKTRGIFAIRADIDALRIQDGKNVPYRSEQEGVMHACGHDGHTAIVAGAITAIAELHESGQLPFRPRIRGIFQPAEETCEGAVQMIEAGVLEGVSAIIATHLDPSRPVGRIGVRPGVFTANCDHMHISIHGCGGHAARPHETRDPITAAAQLINWLYLQIPRATDSQDAVVVTIGMIEGGHTANVIPERIDLQGTLRTLNRDVRQRTMDHVRQLAHAVSEGSQTEVKVTFGVGSNAVENDPHLIELISESATQTAGPDAAEAIARPSMGSEDFAFYSQHVPAAMFRLGCASESIGGPGLHTPLFDFDEEAMRMGARIMARTALRWLESSVSSSRPETLPPIRLGVLNLFISGAAAMQTLTFSSNLEPTLGVELELGLVDNQTMGLTSAINRLLDALPEDMGNVYKPELMQSYIEINTGICDTVEDARRDLAEKLTRLEAATDAIGLSLWWGGTHPFSLWLDQKVTETERYRGLVNLLQEMARRLVTFGLHVHVGVDSGDKAVMICDRIMQHLPTLLSLSCSSAYWEARDTGLHSHRSKIMEGLPTAGLPTLMRNWSEYVWLVNHMVDTGFINTIREIWWDVRPHHSFGTVEVRVCDMPGNLEDVLAITALIQSLVKALSDEIDRGTYQHDCHPMMVRQNKWRACRYGTDAQLVNSFTYKIETVSEIVRFLIERLSPTAESLGCLEYLVLAQEIADRPSWAQRQRDILKRSRDREAIVCELTAQSRISPKVSSKKGSGAFSGE